MPDSRTLILSGSVNEQHKSRSDNRSFEETMDASAAANATESDKEENKVATKNQDTQLGQQNPPFWVNERVSGAFSRSFRFPSPANNDNIKASFEDGTLKVVVSKYAEEQTKKISID